MTDRICIVGMQMYGRHGVLAHETEMGQIFTVDTEICLDLRAAGRTDDLSRTINYAAVFQVVRAVVEGPPLKLIEAVAEQTAARILSEFHGIEQVCVRVHKQRAPIPGSFADVYCEVVRGHG